MLKKILLTPTSTQSAIVASIIICLGLTYLFVFKPPFIAKAIFAALCVMWSAWIFISIFRGRDELQSASLTYALALASGVGVPLSLALVMLMITSPALQNVITNFAALSPLSSAVAGFGLGVSFTIIILCIVLIISHTIWWVSKR